MVNVLFVLIAVHGVLGGSDCDPACKLSLVETIPMGLTYKEGSPSHTETSQVWLDLINNAQKSIDIASLYWTLNGTDVMANPDPSAAKGEEVLSALQKKAESTTVRITVSAGAEDLDTSHIKAEVRHVDMPKLVGAGVLHTKLILVDGKHFYLGSANMDWRSLAQVKELGVFGKDCDCLSNDISKIFSVYWTMGNSSQVPKHWPDELSTDINVTHPAIISSDNLNYTVFLSSSPPEFSPHGRTNDLAAILHAIKSAEHYVNIAVMDYIPSFLYSRKNQYWSLIDDELRRVFINRKVNVKLLISHWNHTRPTIEPFLRSLAALNGYHNDTSIEVKWFAVPSNETFDKIPFARVNHNKYMVTDNTALIGTSNWSADYFVNTAGISIVISPKKRGESNLQSQLNDVFMRDWNSDYATPVLKPPSQDFEYYQVVHV